MLMNFCQKRLKTTVACSTVSNDGYEVTNLIDDSEKGFLAYSCIKPPIHIDFTFTCDVTLSRVLIWPSVGAQKSCGFELCVKPDFGPCSEYRRLSVGFLGPDHSGVTFHRRDIAERDFDERPTFLQCPIRVSDRQIVNNVRNLRISILKTQNSVPAIGRVEIWGRVSQSWDKRVAADVRDLWENNGQRRSEVEAKTDPTDRDKGEEKIGPSSTKLPSRVEPTEEELIVPESYLDPITWSIMIQPIVLPSGVTIDQSTLEKHAKTEATWGRTLSDPFTGMPFTESRKPVVASALKARIDKFLLENKHLPDVAKLPRLSGHKRSVGPLRNPSLNLSKITSEIGVTRKISNSENVKSQLAESSDRNSIRSTMTKSRGSDDKMEEEKRVHRLPVIPMRSKRTIAKRDSKNSKIKTVAILTMAKKFDSGISRLPRGDDPEIKNSLDQSVQNVLSTLRRFDEEDRPITRKCVDDCSCSTEIFYKLPCNHVVCKDVLMSVKNWRCAICGSNYSSRDPQRVHEPS